MRSWVMMWIACGKTEKDCVSCSSLLEGEQLEDILSHYNLSLLASRVQLLRLAVSITNPTHNISTSCGCNPGPGSGPTRNIYTSRDSVPGSALITYETIRSPPVKSLTFSSGRGHTQRLTVSRTNPTHNISTSRNSGPGSTLIPYVTTRVLPKNG
ncbi:hypothetical protein LguiB_012010 [Lonicera macranthoides]